MIISLDCRGMIAVFPESAFSFLPLIEFLASPSGNQLEAFGYRLRFTVDYQEVDVVGSNHKIKHLQAKTLFCLKEPVIPTAPIPGKFQKKFLLVTAMGNMPYLPMNVISVCSRHSLKTQLCRQNCGSKRKNRPFITYYHNNVSMLSWSDPHARHARDHARDHN